MNDLGHLPFLFDVALADVAQLVHKESTYRGSWKAAGGRSAWFMTRRNMDRLINMLARPPTPEIGGYPANDVILDLLSEARETGQSVPISRDLLDWLQKDRTSEDIFAAIADEPSGRDGTVLACVRDLRTYLMLIEAEMLRRQRADHRSPGTTSLWSYLSKELNVPREEIKRAVLAGIYGGVADDEEPAAVRTAPTQEEGAIPPAAPVPAEDSNRHAERAPASDGDLLPLGPYLLDVEPTGDLARCYTRMGPSRWQLHELVDREWDALIPDNLMGYYRQLPSSFIHPHGPMTTKGHPGWMIQREPRLPNYQYRGELTTELNFKEWSDLAPLLQSLYDWQGQKFKLKDDWRAWSLPL